MPTHANRVAIAAIHGGYPAGPSKDGSNSLPANLCAVLESSPNYLLCFAFCAPCASRFTMLGDLISVSWSVDIGGGDNNATDQAGGIPCGTSRIGLACRVSRWGVVQGPVTGRGAFQKVT